MKLFAIIKRY